MLSWGREAQIEKIMRKFLIMCLMTCLSVCTQAQNSTVDYNKYVTCVATSAATTIVGSNVNKTVGFTITNSGNETINITKLVAKDSKTGAILGTSTDTKLLGELKGGEDKSLSITFKQDVMPVFELTYILNGIEYIYDATKYLMLTISSNDFGSIEYADIEVIGRTKKFSVVSGSEAIIKIVPKEECVLSKMSINGTDVTTDIADNSYTITDIKTSMAIAATFDSNSANHPTFDGHEYVDLGLTSGSLWATTNYGADKPEAYGSYSKGNSFSSWGQKWTMPTKDEYQELIDECEWTWTTINEINGYSIKGVNGKTIFLPAAGSKDHWGTSGLGTSLQYMTATDSWGSNVYILSANKTERVIKSASTTLTEYSVRPIAKGKQNTGIVNIMTTDMDNVKRYNLDGTESIGTKKGIVILKSSDGKTKKYVIK